MDFVQNCLRWCLWRLWLVSMAFKIGAQFIQFTVVCQKCMALDAMQVTSFGFIQNLDFTKRTIALHYINTSLRQTFFCVVTPKGGS